MQKALRPWTLCTKGSVNLGMCEKGKYVKLDPQYIENVRSIKQT